MRGVLLSTASLLALLVTTAKGHGLKPSPTPDVVTSFKWQFPFEPEDLKPYNHACEAEKLFPAKQYTLHELMEAPPQGLGPWAPGLKKFFQGREYPGGWAGWDPHLHDRFILKMEYADLPLKVRQWTEEQEKAETDAKGLFAIFKKPEEEDDTIEDTSPPSPGDRSRDQDLVAIFAPGAIYDILPLWVAEASTCADDLSDLSKYNPVHADGGVIAWASHTNPTAAKDITLGIKAILLARKSDWAKEEKKEASGKDKEKVVSKEEKAEEKVKDEL